MNLFLGIDYPPTQPADNTNRDSVINNNINQIAHNTSNFFGEVESLYALFDSPESIPMRPHPRTLRKAREQIKWMGFLPKQSGFICIASPCGGQTLVTLGVMMRFSKSLQPAAGINS